MASVSGSIQYLADALGHQERDAASQARANPLDEWITIFFKHKYFYYILLTQSFDCHVQPSSGILGRQVLPLLASCLGKQDVPYVTQSISPSFRFMTVVVFRIHMASLIHLAFPLQSLSITFAISQSVMQLFLCVWSVIADLCSIAVDTLFSSLVNRLVVMFSISVLCSSSLVPNVLPISPIYVWLQLLQGIWYTYTGCLFTIFYFVLWMH